MKNIWPAKYLALCLCLLGLIFVSSRASAQASFTLSVAPTALTVTTGAQQTAAVVTATSGGFNSAISLSASGVPVGVAVSFNPATIPAPGAGSSIMTVNVLRLARPGTYTVTVNANGGGVKQTATVALT